MALKSIQVFVLADYVVRGTFWTFLSSLPSSVYPPAVSVHVLLWEFGIYLGRVSLSWMWMMMVVFVGDLRTDVARVLMGKEWFLFFLLGRMPVQKQGYE